MDGATNEEAGAASVARETDERLARRRRAFPRFIEAFREVKKRRAHDHERKAVDALVDCVGVEEPKRETFHEAWTLLDRLVEDEIGAWAELFRHAIEAAPLPDSAWHDLKACQGDGSLRLVIMTRRAELARGPEEIAFYGDTRGLLGGMTDGLEPARAQHYMLEDGMNVFLIRTA